MIAPITHRSSFAALAADGRRVRHGAVRLTHLADAPFCASERMSVGYVFGRRFGNAVERNRARRRLRAAIQLETASRRDITAPAAEECIQVSAPPGAFLFTGSRALLTAPFADIRSDVARCLARVALDQP